MKNSKKNNAPSGRDKIYRIVTDCVIQALEKAKETEGIVPWHRATYGTEVRPINYVSRIEYHGINLITLEPGEWLTWNQIKTLGGKLKKGSHGRPVLYFNKVTKKETNPDTGEETEKSYWLEKYYTVFNVADIEGLDSHSVAFIPPQDPYAESEKYLDDYTNREFLDGLKVTTGIGPAPIYSKTEDTIYLPALSQKDKDNLYWAKVFKAMIRSTGGGTRLCRKNFYNDGPIPDVREELLDEMGSAMLINCAGFNCEELFKDTVSYIDGWIKAMKADCRLVVEAATRAEKAVRFILDDNFQKVSTSDDDQQQTPLSA